MACTFRWLRMLETGRFATIRELAAAEKINVSYVSRILLLTLLPPGVVEAILDGRQSGTNALPDLEGDAATGFRLRDRGEGEDQPVVCQPGAPTNAADAGDRGVDTGWAAAV